MESPIRLLEKALESRPDDWALRRRVIELAKDDPTSRHLAFRLISATPDLADNLEARLLHAQLVGEADASQERAMLEDMLATWPDSEDVHEQLSLACRALGDEAAADSHLVVARTLAPERGFEGSEEGGEGGVADGGWAPVVAPVAIAPARAVVSGDEGGDPWEGAFEEPAGGRHGELGLEVVSAAKIEPARREGTRDRAAAALVALLVHVAIALVLAALALSLPRPRTPEITAVSSASQDPTPQVRQQRIAPPAPQVRPSAGAPAPELLTAATASAVAAPEIRFDAPAEQINLGAGFGAGSGFGNQNMGGGMSFFGVRSEGATVLVIDISGSMMMGGRDYNYIEREAIRTLQRLPRGTQFNVILFAGKSYPFRERGLVAAEPRVVEEVVEWMKDMSPALNTGNVPWAQFKGGLNIGTRTDLALEHAFDMKPRTIVLLSDGSPTGVKPRDIYTRVSEWQKEVPRPVTINTVSYRAPAQGVEFLVELSESNSGRFKDL